MKKVILGIVVVLAIVVGIGFFQGGKIIKSGVETYGPEVIGAPIAVGGVDYSLLDGDASIQNLTVGNPEGFKTDEAFSVGEISIKMNPQSVFSDVVHIQELRIASPSLTYEPAKGGSNFLQLQEHAAAFSGGEETESTTKMIIDNLYLTGGKVTYASGGPLGSPSIDLPDIHLTDIGKEENGATAADVTGQVMKEIGPVITKVVASIPGVEQVTDLLGVGGEAGKDVIGGVGDTVKKGLGGLFGKKSKEEAEQPEEN